MNELIKKVEHWVHDTGIADKATLRSQLKKMKEEVKELEECIDTMDSLYFKKYMSQAEKQEVFDNAVMESGDVQVTTISMNVLLGIHREKALSVAYGKIAPRLKTGKMVGDTFVKSEDLPDER